jgi:hypothetical protein
VQRRLQGLIGVHAGIIIDGARGSSAAEEAQDFGLVERLFDDLDRLCDGALRIRFALFRPATLHLPLAFATTRARHPLALEAHGACLRLFALLPRLLALEVRRALREMLGARLKDLLPHVGRHLDGMEIDHTLEALTEVVRVYHKHGGVGVAWPGGGAASHDVHRMHELPLE